MSSVLLLALIYVAHSTNASEQALPRPQEDGNALFLKNCATCHGKDGRAKTFKAKFNHARNLTDPVWQASITDEHIYESILKGKKKMPAFEKKLSKHEIEALVTYVRMLKKRLTGLSKLGTDILLIFRNEQILTAQISSGK